jgi:hypothetical protein
VSKPTRDTTTATPGGLPGPDADLSQVLERFEHAGHRDPAAAWNAFTGTWNWAALLDTAPAPVDGDSLPVVRSVAGGFLLSGRWRRPMGGRSEWLALPPGADRRRFRERSAKSDRNLFVVPVRALPRALPGTEGTHGSVAFELTDMYVGRGLATHTAGTALRAGEADFLRVAVTAMALGAARSLTDVVAALVPAATADACPEAGVTADAAAELAAVLYDERTALAAAVRGIPAAGHTRASAVAEPAATLLAQVGTRVRHVVVAAYEQTLPLTGWDGVRHADRVARLVEDAAPVLQCMRFATERMPPVGHLVEGPTQ